MARAAEPARALQEELLCAICLDYYSEPVMLSCEHNFCRPCILAYWRDLGGRLPCPQCRKRSYRGSLRPNRQLGKVAERAKELAAAASAASAAASAAEPPGARRGSRAEAPRERCRQHGEPLKLFCRQEEAPICVVCDRSKEHRGHAVAPVEEAAEEYKAQFRGHLEKLKTERDNREILGVNHGKRLKMLVGRAETEKQRATHTFEQLQKILQDRQTHILQGLSRVTSDLRKMQQANSCKVRQGTPLLQGLITELEQKCQQSDTELLKDAKNLINRCKTCNFPKWSPEPTTEIEERIFHFSRKKTALWDHMTDTKELLTLDPDSAHPCLSISSDLKTASRRIVCPPRQNTSKRFCPSFCVLGSEGFKGGRHRWMVEVKGKCGWALGVAQESVERKKPVLLQPEHGIWAVELGPYQLFGGSSAAGVEPDTWTRRILVTLDYEAGRLTFSESCSVEPLFTFRASFTEKLYPFFWLWSPEASITLCS